MNNMERRQAFEECKRKHMIKILQNTLQTERARNDTLEEEVMNLFQRLHTFTRRSIPRKAKRMRRRITEDEESTVTVGSNSDTKYEDEDAMNNTLVRLMDFDV